MADLFVKQTALAGDVTFQSRVRAAMFIALIATQGEAQGGMTNPTYLKRQAFAEKALANATAYVERFAWATATNSNVGAVITNPVAITSSTAVNPCVVTTTAVHGFTTGDTVVIAGHVANTAINGGWIATVLTTTTFSIPTLGIAAGTATGTACRQPTDIDIQVTVNNLISEFAGVTGTDG
jgi:hypothetical protein